MRILRKPLITKKVAALNTKGVYGLFVDCAANKVQIRKAVEQVYGVVVLRVHTLRYAGKKKTRYTKAGLSKGQRASYKKALVTLQEGEVLDFYREIDG